MKTIFVVLFTLVTLNSLYSQNELEYKIKLERFKSMEHTGKVLTIIGIPCTIIGTASVITGYAIWDNVSYTTSDVLLYGGYIVGGLGALSLINGIIFKSIGHRKANEYQMRLDNLKISSYCTPNHIGLTLTYKF
jgi:hypothetical protein